MTKYWVMYRITIGHKPSEIEATGLTLRTPLVDFPDIQGMAQQIGNAEAVRRKLPPGTKLLVSILSFSKLDESRIQLGVR